MIVYQGNKQSFQRDILTNNIQGIILDLFKEKLNKRVGIAEFRSWKNSMMYMHNVLLDDEIPNDASITVEYQIPQSSKRIDFIIAGQNEKKDDYAVLVELKQWDKVQLTDKDAVVVTRFRHGDSEEPHPSYQAWSYAKLLQGFNETVYEENIQLKPCAYLHNYEEDDIINNSFYSDYIDKAPLFLRDDLMKLRKFIKEYVKHGDKTNIMYRIDNGKIKPSKSLADSVHRMLKGNQEFIMIDDQKIVYENALSLARKSTEKNKHVYIVEGGPGTGKSVVAINLLVKLLDMGLNARYVSKNAAPRNVYEAKLTESFKKSEISNLFSGSGTFTESMPNDFDVLIIDEAHRLNAKSGIFKNQGENQIKEIINAAKNSVFFIDEDQKVTLQDIGDKDEIEKWAKYHNATVHFDTLSSQFRCNGSEGYLAWVDNVLQIRETANMDLKGIDFDFQVVNSPKRLFDMINDKNRINNKARMVAGYCWDWKSKRDPRLYDIQLTDFNFKKKWNLTRDGSLWIISPESVNEVGCIHTCQGLEVDYVGVIIGPDMVVRDSKVITDPTKRSKMDQSIKGYKALLKEQPEKGGILLDKIIKNTYRTLMTRGMKGCYVYCVDKNVEEYFMSRM